MANREGKVKLMALVDQRFWMWSCELLPGNATINFYIELFRQYHLTLNMSASNNLLHPRHIMVANISL